jgi:CheY-like chemotaxis protein
MTDNRNSGRRKAGLISLTKDRDITYWTKKFAVSQDRLAEAVRRVGPSAEAVEKFLKNPHADAKFRIVAEEGMAYSVEVSIPGLSPTMLKGFATTEQAESWIAEHRQRIAGGPVRRRWARPSPSTVRSSRDMQGVTGATHKGGIAGINPSAIESRMRAILLVEDDDAFRYAASRHLITAGFRVTAMRTTSDALQLDVGHEVDAFVVDIAMPAGNPNGVSFGRAIQRRLPSSRILFMTAFPDRLRGCDLPGKLLFKPFPLDTLTEEIRALFPVPPGVHPV